MPPQWGSMSREAYLLQGGNGGRCIDAAEGPVTGSFRWVQVVNDTVLAGLTNTLVNSGDLAGLTLPAGLGIGGITTSIEVTSGMVIAYNE